MKPKGIISHSMLALIHDIFMAALSFMLALYLRLGTNWLDYTEEFLAMSVGLFVIVCTATFIYMRLYRGIWHFASMEDLMAITKAVTLSTLIFAFLMLSISHLEAFPRLALIINWMLLVFLLGAPRLAYRLFKDKGLKFALKREDISIPVILYGCGRRAEIFIREALRGHQSIYKPIAIIDTDPEFSGRTLHGVKIYDGSLDTVMKKLERQNVKAHRLVIAKDIESETLQMLMQAADEHGLTLSQLPPADQLQKNKATLTAAQQLRPVDIEDLLGRPQATRNPELMRDFIRHKTVLVTGAGGSIGSELCRQLASHQVSKLILFEHSEFALYKMHEEISRLYPKLTVETALIDLRHKKQLENCLVMHKPDIIFHAAAIKHVPLSECHPIAAVHTNVIGTKYLLDAAEQAGVNSVVLISSDKAVHPTNIMGATKRLAEKIFLHKEMHPSLTAVRFGNVLGSAGSVIPLFEEQIARGGPVTVTDPNVTRYFMTIREAVDLVIHAAALAQKNGIKRALYVLDMGKPIPIINLAKQLIRLSGLRPEDDIVIKFTGLRPGEKLFEELFYAEEAPEATELPSIMQSKRLPDAATNLEKELLSMLAACENGDDIATLNLLKNLTPEYKSPPQARQNCA